MNVAPIDLPIPASRGAGPTPGIPTGSGGQSLEVVISDQGVDTGRQPETSPNAAADLGEPAYLPQRDLGLYSGRGMTVTMPAEGLQGQLLDVTG